MSPIIGIIDSQKSGHLYTIAGSYEQIGSVTVPSGGLASVTFGAIPQTYAHLQLKMLARSTQSGTGNASNLYLNLNSDSGANYTYHYLKGNGTSASALANTARTAAICTFPPKNGETSGIFGASIVDILDYTNTNKYTTLRHIEGYDANGSGEIFFYSNLWLNTAAITSITLASDSGNIAEFSSFALYGVKG